MGLIQLVDKGVAWLLQRLIRLYQLTLSPFIGNQCRFYPSCSHYAQDAVTQFGPWRGSWLTLRRLGRCHPFAEGGLDPVPVSEPGPCAQPELEQQLSNSASISGQTATRNSL